MDPRIAWAVCVLLSLINAVIGNFVVAQIWSAAGIVVLAVGRNPHA